MPRVSKVLLLVVLLLLSVNLVANAIGEVTGTFEETACSFQRPAGIQVDCGYLTVPENYDNPDGAQIRLAVAILRHPSGNPEPDPIIYLEGGPGGSALELLYLTAARFEPVFAANRDIILFDQRGVGVSEPALDCPALDDFAYDVLDYEYEGEELTIQEILTIANDTLAQCGTELAQEADLTQYNSANNAADVEALRLALGYEQVNLWGISYGTRLGLTVMRDYPAGIRSVVLDSVVPLETEFEVQGPNSYNRALEVLFTSCAEDEACNAAYPELESVFYDTIEALNETPAVFTASNPLTGVTYEDITFTGYDFSSAIFQMLYSAELLPVLPQIIYDTSEGDFEGLRTFMTTLFVNQGVISVGMNRAVNCYEERPFIDFDSMQAILETFPGYTPEDAQLDVAGYVAICDAFQPAAASAIEDEPVISDLPTLVTSGEFDPVTPPAFAEQVADVLPNSTYIEFPANGHGPTGGDECAIQIMTDFINDPAAEVDTSCVDDLQISFNVPGGAAAEVNFVPLDLTEYNINATTIIPDSWISTEAPGGIVVFSRGESALDQTSATFLPLPGVRSAQLVRAALAVQFDISEEPDFTLETDVFEWTVYSMDVQGFPGYLGVTIVDDNAIVVLFIGDETLRDTVLIPMLEAFEPVE